METNIIPGFDINRKNILRLKNLEDLQEEFMKGNKKLSVKYKKEEIKEEKTKHQISSDKKNAIASTNISSVKKKKKDVISMDLNLFNIEIPSDIQRNNFSNLNKTTLFSQNLKINKVKQTSKEIDIHTGLPKIIDISYNKNNNNSPDFSHNQMDNKDIYDRKFQANKVIFEKMQIKDIKDEEYNSIHKKNLEVVSNMSKEEIFTNLETIKSIVPPELVEKMKKGFFQKSLSLNIDQAKIYEKIGVEENEKSEDENEDQNLMDKNNINDIDSQKDFFINKNKDILIVDFEGNVKYINENDFEFSTINEKLEYINMRFENFDLKTKKFSLNELLNLIQSSSDNLNLMGLKILSNLMKNLSDVFTNTDKSIFVKNNDEQKYDHYRIQFDVLKFLHEKNILQLFSFTLDHRNINIRLNSIKNFNIFSNLFFNLQFKTLKYNLIRYQSFPIIKADILNIGNQEIDSEYNFIYFKKNLFLFDFLKKIYDQNFISNFYLIKKNFENFLAIIKLDKELRNTPSNKSNEHFGKKIENFADENLLIEYLDFLKLNCFYSDHFVIKFINSEMIDVLFDLIKYISLNVINVKNNKRIEKIMEKLFITITLNNFESSFINSSIKRLADIISQKEYDTILNINLKKKIRPILFYFKSLKEIFFENELKYFSANLDLDNSYDIFTLIKLINEKNLECILQTLKESGKFHLLSFNNIIYTHNKNPVKNFPKILSRISNLMNLRMKLIKYIISCNLDEKYYLFNDDMEIKSFLNFFNETLIHFKKESESKIEGGNTYICLNNFDIHILNSFVNFFNTNYKLKMFIDKYPKTSNYKKIFDEETLIKDLDQVNSVVLSFTITLKNQIIKDKSQWKNEDKKPLINSSVSQSKESPAETCFDIKDYKIKFLSYLENFLNFFLNILKMKTLNIEMLFNKQQLKLFHFNNEFCDFVSQIPNFINVFGESKYFKYIKYLEKLIHIKYTFFKQYVSEQNYASIFDSNKIKNIDKVFERISDSLKVLINSNEDLRKSIQTKKIFQICEFLNKDNIYFNEFNKLTKSKYFPILENYYNKNFMIQIFTNEKIGSELKLNFFFVYIILFISFEKENQNTSPFSNINDMDILLRTILNFSDKIYKNIAEILFDEYIRKFIFENLNKFETGVIASCCTMTIFKNKPYKTYDNEIDMENFYSKFDDFYQDETEQLNLYYKFIIIIFIYFNSFDFKYHRNLLKNNNNLEGSNLREDILRKEKKLLYNINNFNNVLSSKYIFILGFSNWDNLKFIFNSKDNFSLNIINYFIQNLDIVNYEMYEILILEFLKYFSIDVIKVFKNKQQLNDYNKDAQAKITEIKLKKNRYSLNIDIYSSKNLIFDFTIALLKLFQIGEIKVMEDAFIFEMYIIKENFEEDDIKMKIESFRMETLKSDIIDNVIQFLKENLKKIVKSNIYYFFLKEKHE